MSVLSALQKLLVKMGGQPSVGDNTDETLDKIADLYSGGGGLPPYENEDINKVLTLADSGQSVTETFVAIEEQTVTTDNRFGTASLTVSSTYWAEGRTVHLTVNGDNYDCVIDSDGYIHAVVDEHDVRIRTSSGVPGDKNFNGYSTTTYTVSATIEAPIPIPAPAWVTPPNVPFFIGISEETVDEETVLVSDKTPSEVTAAFNSGRVIYVSLDEGFVPVSGIYVDVSARIRVISAQNVEVDSANGVYSSQLFLRALPNADEFQVSWTEQTYPPSQSQS